MAKNKSKIYYLLLGLGLGIVLTSSINITLNKPKHIEYSEQEIIEKARALGMISVKENIEANSKKDKEKNNESNTEDNSKEVSNESQLNQQSSNQTNNQPDTYATINIGSGDTATSIVSRLKDSGVIQDKDDFMKVLKENRLQGKFITGTHQVKINGGYDEILKTLIKEKDIKNVSTDGK